ncbi:hypothetical protein ULG90_16490 [Halopseudomonas pachastrellae]|nr:hypothetical protein ULG90_16490 [Halopseudomonas pachastrellae]
MGVLIKNAQAVFSPTAADATDIRISDGKITELGRDLALAADETLIDARGLCCMAWPGQHSPPSGPVDHEGRAGRPEPELNDWLGSVPYRYWPKVTPELMYHAARLGLYELLRSGGTTCADHHYLYHASTAPSWRMPSGAPPKNWACAWYCVAAAPPRSAATTA